MVEIIELVQVIAYIAEDLTVLLELDSASLSSGLGYRATSGVAPRFKWPERVLGPWET